MGSALELYKLVLWAHEAAVLLEVFKKPLAGAAARRFFEIFEKIGFFENLVKIGFFDGFGPIWIPDSNSA